MDQLDGKTAIKLLNDAMPGMGWRDWGRAGFQTEAILTEAAATKLMESFKKKAGLSQDAEIEVKKGEKGYSIAINDPLGPDGITGDVASKLMNPIVKAKLQVDTAAAKAEIGQDIQLQRQGPPPNMNNLQVPQTQSSLEAGQRSK